MDITFSYTITEMVKAPSQNDLTDVVTAVSFVYSGEVAGGPKIDWAINNVVLPAPDPENFKPIEELTEEEVIAWVQAAYPIGPVTEAITQKIDDIINPKEVVTDLPWTTPEQ